MAYHRFSPGTRTFQIVWQDAFLQWEVVSTSFNPQAGGPHHVGCPWLLIQYTDSYPPYWRPFLHPQPEDRPCCGEKDPLTGHGPKPEHYHKDPTVNSAHYFTMRCEKMRPAIISRTWALLSKLFYHCMTMHIQILPPKLLTPSYTTLRCWHALHITLT